MNFDQEDITYLDTKFENIHGRISDFRKEVEKKIEARAHDQDTSIKEIDGKLLRVLSNPCKDAETHEQRHHPNGECVDTKRHESRYHDWPKFWKMSAAIVGIMCTFGAALVWALRHFIHEAVSNGIHP